MTPHQRLAATPTIGLLLILLAAAFVPSPAHAEGRHLADPVVRRAVRGFGKRAWAFDLAARRLSTLRSDPEPGVIRGVRGQLENTELRPSSSLAWRDQYRYFADEAARLATESLAPVRLALTLHIAPPLAELERSLALAEVAGTFSSRARSPGRGSLLLDAQAAVDEELDGEIRSAVYHGEVQRTDRLIELMVAHLGEATFSTHARDGLRNRLHQALEGRLELALWGTRQRPGIVVSALRAPPRFAAIEGSDTDHRNLEGVRRGIEALASHGGSVEGLRRQVREIERGASAAGGTSD
jgi:hypothetical protein